MTEKEWKAAREPLPLLLVAPDPVRRKLHLFSVACCRRIWVALGDARLQRAVEQTERFADGAIGVRELANARRAAKSAERFTGDGTIEEVAARTVIGVTQANAFRSAGAAQDAASVFAHVIVYGCPDTGLSATKARQSRYTAEERREKGVQADLVREIFENPFRPVSFDPAWRTPDVVSLAEGAYEEKAFDRLPILADALQDAGCDSDPLLSHLRDEVAPHVRGCWALDLVLGRS